MEGSLFLLFFAKPRTRFFFLSLSSSSLSSPLYLTPHRPEIPRVPRPQPAGQDALAGPPVRDSHPGI
jgi:hypothetical protein